VPEKPVPCGKACGFRENLGNASGYSRGNRIRAVLGFAENRSFYYFVIHAYALADPA